LKELQSQTPVDLEPKSNGSGSELEGTADNGGDA